METKQQEMVRFEKAQGGQFRWVAVTALLLAIGAILHLVTPNVGGVTPNWTIAMYCIAINLTRPSLGQAAGIGLVAGAVNIPTSKSAFPYGNLASELVGALICAAIVNSAVNFTVGRFNFRPAVCALISTLGSGFTFITILKLVLSLPMTVYLYAMVPVVLAVAAVNTVITQLLYFPAQKLFAAKGGQ
ncbi:tryptophan transporter [Sporolituus thermophilus]|uniref:Energy-coupling factor transport system ATP-binding protein n=1 Tax=Sporolituus thermophilus DSM 23256 TaxID=1123285 RepID=A0A1G7JWN8_9FIRM|nr:tryptophan transporter [Sporolituus thermophilus]SDF29378.1 energy-coupling factor transport system ATP-binding protein [Sporolituus thermophilus DSM 23256]